MDDHAFDCSTDDDELIDEEMMFFLEQEVETHLTMQENQDPSTSSSSRHFFESPSSQRDLEAMRPSNPVAQLLETDEGEEDVPALPTFGARAITMDEPFATFFSTPAHGQGTSEESPSFEYYNGRRKRKYFDDSCCVTPPVRPMAKRAKSFSQVQLPKLPSLEVSPPLLKPVKVAFPVSTPMAIPTTKKEAVNTPLPALKVNRSTAIPITQPSTFSVGAQVSKVIRAASDPTSTCMSAPNISSSSPLEYFCCRSLDISSPLRIRFRDLVVSSVGSVSSS